MKTFKEYRVETAKVPYKYAVSKEPHFKDKLTLDNLSADEFKRVNNGAQSISRGGGTYNSHVLNKDDIPTESSTDDDKKRIAKAFNIIFDHKRKLGIDGAHVLYHGMKHEPKFDVEGDDFTTRVNTSVSTTPIKKKAETFAAKNKDLSAHHVLAIHYDSEKHSNVPAVSITNHSAYKTEEEEVIMPPRTVFKHINTEPTGIHPKTGKPTFVHHVEPMYTHPAFDHTWKSWPKDKMIKQKTA